MKLLPIAFVSVIVASAAAPPAIPTTMKAVAIDKPGGPEVLEIRKPWGRADSITIYFGLKAPG